MIPSLRFSHVVLNYKYFTTFFFIFCCPANLRPLWYLRLQKCKKIIATNFLFKLTKKEDLLFSFPWKVSKVDLILHFRSNNVYTCSTRRFFNIHFLLMDFEMQWKEWKGRWTPLHFVHFVLFWKFTFAGKSPLLKLWYLGREILLSKFWYL